MNLPPLPSGYEPHELPADYTGALYIEGQMLAYATAAAAAARAEERAACAKVCDDLANQWMQIAASCGGDDAHEVARSYMADELADAIRARGE